MSPDPSSSADVKTSVGVVGLGAMGLPIAANLVSAGFGTVVWNRSPGPVARVALRGALPAGSPKEVGGRCPVVLTVLPDEPQLREVLFGRDGLIEGMRAGSLLVIMGTVAAATAKRLGVELAEKSIRVVDAPMSGGDVAAQLGTLSIMAGGETTDIQALEPIFAAVAKTVRRVGPLGSGQLAKACNQIVVAATLVALAEAVTLGRRGGLDPETLLEALAGGLAGSRALEVKGHRLLTRDYAPGGRASFQAKDLGFALAAARQHGVTLPVTALVDQLFLSMCQTGHADDDHSGVIQVIELLSGLVPPTANPGDESR